MKANYISSHQLIDELINDYNISSSDFIPRCGMWIKNCIKELGIYQGFTQHRQIGVFGIDVTSEDNGVFEFDRDSVYGFNLPDGFISMERLKLNGVTAHEKGKDVKVVDEREDTNLDYLKATPDDPSSRFILLFNSNNTPTNKEDVTYHIEMNYVHTSLENGTYDIIYRGIPTEVYNDIKYPMIMDDGMLKKAIKLYILKMMLIRGYKHGILSLEKNNVYSNPAMEFDSIKLKVRTSCNRFTKDERKALATTMIKIF